MFRKLSQLSFVIGLFFTIVSLILFGNMVVNDQMTGLNWFTSIIFFIFGIAMMFVKERKPVDSNEGKGN